MHFANLSWTDIFINEDKLTEIYVNSVLNKWQLFIGAMLYKIPLIPHPPLPSSPEKILLSRQERELAKRIQDF